MSLDQSARDEALELFEARVMEAARKGIDSIPCDSCRDGAQIRITISEFVEIVIAQCDNYHDPLKRPHTGPGCGNPRIMKTGPQR